MTATATTTSTMDPTSAATPGTGATPGVRDLLRRIPVPASEPPFDDEERTRNARSAGRTRRLHADRAYEIADLTRRQATQGTLALDLADPVAPAQPDTEPAPARHLSLVADPAGDSEEEQEDALFARQSTPTVALPDPRPWSGRFVQALVEALTGRRAVAQLLRWTDESVYAELQQRARTAARLTGTASRSHSHRPVVRSVHVCQPQDGVAEASVHVRHGGRSRAIAVRLEGLDGRWRCTALQLG